MNSVPLLSIKNLCKEFQTGNEKVTILKNINLDIFSGEMLAIVGASGSGKSTLMNILGCLDQLSSGSYKIDNVDVNKLSSNELANLRNKHFGFIFQKYYLLGNLSAQENVEMPAIYAGTDKKTREEKAQKILKILGLGDRINHKPNQLSGGQQQRVSIARSLVNDCNVILADEPTGALDSKSGSDVLNILKGLNEQGHTIIIVTHDMNVAKKANRIIEIKDGEIISDKKNQIQNEIINIKKRRIAKHKNSFSFYKELLKISILSILSHKLRSILTMLGIIIGIASVVTSLGIGKGVENQFIEQIKAMGSKTIMVYRGNQSKRIFSGNIKTLTMKNVEYISKMSFVDSVSPSAEASTKLKYQNKELGAIVSGVNEDYFRVLNNNFIEGSSFSLEDINNYTTVGVIDERTKKVIFDKNESNIIGKTIIIKNIPIKIIGIIEDTQANTHYGETPIIWMPYTAVLSRILGQSYLSSVIVRLKDDVNSESAEKSIKDYLLKDHRQEDFTLYNADQIEKEINKATMLFRVLLFSIAIISLLVGGIGVMNIMLVSVTERTSEIGVRMAVGAKQLDILIQFLAESILLCLIGAIIGILLSYSVGYILKHFSPLSPIYTVNSILMSMFVSCLVGIAFGFFPARNASKLNPVTALSRE